jgi:hypothetical protein
MAIAALEAEAFLVWPRLEVRRYARRLGRRLGLGKVRRRVQAAAAKPQLPVLPSGDDPHHS